MIKGIWIALLLVPLAGCSDGPGAGGGSQGEHELARVVDYRAEWANLTPVANTYQFSGGLVAFVVNGLGAAYDQNVELTTYLDRFGQVAATGSDFFTTPASGAICLVVWRGIEETPLYDADGQPAGSVLRDASYCGCISAQRTGGWQGSGVTTLSGYLLSQFASTEFTNPDNPTCSACLTDEEAALCDEIKNATEASAPRLNGTPPPGGA